jgi:hypothetical protein
MVVSLCVRVGDKDLVVETFRPPVTDDEMHTPRLRKITCIPSSDNFPLRSLSFRQCIGMVADPSSVRVYTVNGPAAGASSSLPDWLIRKRAGKKGKRAQREHVEGTLELIQHFEFPEASNKIKTTRDGHHVIATGTYKPQMRVWDLDQLSLKFERHSDAENVDFLVSELIPAPALPSTLTRVTPGSLR